MYTILRLQLFKLNYPQWCSFDYLNINHYTIFLKIFSNNFLFRIWSVLKCLSLWNNNEDKKKRALNESLHTISLPIVQQRTIKEDVFQLLLWRSLWTLFLILNLYSSPNSHQCFIGIYQNSDTSFFHLRKVKFFSFKYFIPQRGVNAKAWSSRNSNCTRSLFASSSVWLVFF